MEAIKTVLVTGGAGYIGSHICVELLDAGYDVVVVDNLSNSRFAVIERIERITAKKVHFYHQDVREAEALSEVFKAHSIDAVIHLAGLKAVGESCAEPIRYYQNNLDSTLVLLQVMQQANVGNFVFSSSATVYGDPETVPMDESFPLFATNPYGRSKLFIEQMLADVVQSRPELFKVALLRYFNPAGAHPSGLIGEDPAQIPNNLLPYVTQVAIGKLEKLSVFGSDYPTVDGTGVRDYIHVIDLARGHVKALQFLEKQSAGMCTPINLGAGHGYSVLEIVKTFELVTGISIPYELVDRRAGDVAIYYANASLASALLGWKTEKTLEDMLIDAWRWQQQNPEGYGD
ncbi:UDP-glucose 4-epimerase GalE [Methylophaga sp. OBS3]|uniref:UDP-glucose 4-epimerase GalE n=1 Tax=Methylophaga sp. OBS3 TaxID=2991934 RepID=UPI00225A33BC|nr:UDP-glucose 4-epimerase GalE [Methylophaga sp. OBS3]MCX4190750.1 UDP-glucose 4-epimerase GalE [Methylophaga sp. OBS3]